MKFKSYSLLAAMAGEIFFASCDDVERIEVQPLKTSDPQY